MPTLRQRRGSAAEDVALAHVEQLGWRIVARNVKVGQHDEIDIVAMDPGPPRELVCLEVRSASSPVFGSPEERIDSRKVRNLYRAMRAMSVDSPLPRRVDIVVVDRRSGSTVVRHLRRVEPA